MEDGSNRLILHVQSSRGETDSIGTKWLVTVSGAPEKNYTAEFQQAQIQWKEVPNKEKSNEVAQGKTHLESTTQIWTTPPKIENLQLLYWSPIHPLTTVKDRLENLSPKKPEPLKQKT